MAWEPISEAKLLEAIEAAEFAMQPCELASWCRIRIRPVKWPLSPWGDLGGGFWVVAVMGQHCIWFNDIEDGFNASSFTAFGTIGEYGCNQAELDECIRWYCQDFMRELLPRHKEQE
jgi:hypothetical protein